MTDNSGQQEKVHKQKQWLTTTAVWQSILQLLFVRGLRVQLRLHTIGLFASLSLCAVVTAPAVYAQEHSNATSESVLEQIPRLEPALAPTVTPVPTVVTTPTPIAKVAPDAVQPMEVEADHLEYDGKQRVSRFSGNVQVKKGGITMRGSSLTVSDRKGQGQTGELRGNTNSAAHFSQSRINPGESIEGQAQRIRYIGAQDKVIFSGNARLRRYINKQVADEISGETIIYSNRTGIFSVNGQTAEATNPSDGKTAGKSGRVRVILTPRD